jgi:hypothetical protein
MLEGLCLSTLRDVVGAGLRVRFEFRSASFLGILGESLLSFLVLLDFA